MTETKKVTKNVAEEVKSTELIIDKVESDAIIVNVAGWRMRVFFDKNFKGKVGKGLSINVDYTGDLEDVHSVKFLPLTK